MRKAKFKMNSKDFDILEAWEASDKTPEALNQIAEDREIRPQTVAYMLREYGCEDAPLVAWIGKHWVILYGDDAQKYQETNIKGLLAKVTYDDLQTLIKLKLAGKSNNEILAAMQKRNGVFTQNTINKVWHNTIKHDPDLRYEAALARRRRLYAESIAQRRRENRKNV